MFLLVHLPVPTLESWVILDNVKIWHISKKDTTARRSWRRQSTADRLIDRHNGLKSRVNLRMQDGLTSKCSIKCTLMKLSNLRMSGRERRRCLIDFCLRNLKFRESPLGSSFFPSLISFSQILITRHNSNLFFITFTTSKVSQVITALTREMPLQKEQI